LPKSILVIDDDVSVRELLVSVLSAKQSFKVTAAKGGKEGLELAIRLHPDLIVLDINMPDLNGFEVLKRLKESEKTVSIPVVMLSALCDDDSKQKAASLYNEAYLTKPVDIKVLRSCIERILGGAANDCGPSGRPNIY
jgi:two-component system sensor histidine kinase/response regulator